MKHDTPSNSREAVHARELELKRVITACEATGSRNAAIVEEFEAAEDA